MQGKKVSVAIPASVVSDTPHLREKTSKIGLIGRSAAMFRINEIIVYPDDLKVEQTREMRLITLLLSYIETPQYLRKELFKLQPELQFAGILPPLRTPHHPLNKNSGSLKIGDYREGVTLAKTNEGTRVDIGVEQHALILNNHLPVGGRVTVKIVRIGKQVEVELASRDEASDYWGYTVSMEHRSLKEIADRKRFDLIIATSKNGVLVNDVADKMTEKWRVAKTILLAFGAPTRGLYEIAESASFSLDDVADFVVNTVPRQGTVTVRTEEALIASLSVLNCHVFKA